MISREDVETAIRDISTFVDELGDSPMGGRSLVARQWDNARYWLLHELSERP